MKRILLFLFFIFTALSTQAGLFDKKPAFLPVDDAFQFSAAKSDNQENVIVNWSIAEGYYLYQEKISVKLNQVETSSFDVPTFSISPEDYNDPYFGLMKIFKKPVQAIFKASQSPLKAEDVVEIAYQGCTEGFCYPPEVKEIKVADLPIAQVANTEKISENSTALSAQPKAEQYRLAESLFNSKYAVFGFFLLGLGLAFTPCVLPMLPLLSAIVIGQNQRPNMWRAFALSFVYVQGENGKLERRNVVTGKSVWGSYTQILSGITMDDLIAFPYGKNVKPGVPTEQGDYSTLYEEN